MKPRTTANPTAKQTEEKPSNHQSIEHSDVHYTRGIDTYVNAGDLVGTIALKPEKRKAFFDARPHILALLLHEEENPLIEEGKYNEEARDRNGEHYLTYEAISLLIEKKICNHIKSENGLTYNTKNIFVIKNDEDALITVLKNLDLKDQEDAKIIYISEIHSVPFYVRNENGNIKCFIVDPEAGIFDDPEEIIDSVSQVYSDAAIYLSDTTLQKDYYSCATLAVKTMMYFAKHGSEIFSWLERFSEQGNEEKCKVLPAAKLMPTLLKMCQSKLSLTDDILDALVSHKNKMTLREYYANYAVQGKKKLFNGAALFKKYKYLFELSEYVDGSRSGATLMDRRKI